jgi:excisionase family DNA binding protein
VVTTAPVTIEQAAAILGVSASTIRRRIKSGALRVEETRRPQGVVWLVHLPSGATVGAGAATVDTASVTTTASTPAPPGEAIAAMIQATLTPIIAPLVAELAASRQANERQAETIARQAEALGELRVELASAQAKIATLDAPTAPQPPEPSTEPWRRWRYLWPLLAFLTVLALLVAGAIWLLVLR